METLITDPLANSVIDQFENLPPRAEGGTRDRARPRKTASPYRLTSRHIEAEVLARLARKGYDWTDTLNNGDNYG